MGAGPGPGELEPRLLRRDPCFRGRWSRWRSCRFRYAPPPASPASPVPSGPRGLGAQPQPAGKLEDPQREWLAGTAGEGPRLRAQRPVEAGRHPGTVCGRPAGTCSRVPLVVRGAREQLGSP